MAKSGYSKGGLLSINYMDIKGVYPYRNQEEKRGILLEMCGKEEGVTYKDFKFSKIDDACRFAGVDCVAGDVFFDTQKKMSKKEKSFAKKEKKIIKKNKKDNK